MSDETTSICPFSNGEAYRIWLYNNCSRCVKRPDCPLEYALASACVLDGTIAPDIARRLGVPDDGSEQWWCRERQTADEPVSWPPPAIEGDRVPLPGFEDVAPKPAERRYPS